MRVYKHAFIGSTLAPTVINEISLQKQQQQQKKKNQKQMIISMSN